MLILCLLGEDAVSIDTYAPAILLTRRIINIFAASECFGCSASSPSSMLRKEMYFWKWSITEQREERGRRRNRKNRWRSRLSISKRYAMTWTYPASFPVFAAFLDLQRVSSYLNNSYSKIQASRFDPRMIDQMKVDTGSNVVPLSTIAQVAAKTQISFVVTPFDPSVMCCILY